MEGSEIFNLLSKELLFSFLPFSNTHFSDIQYDFNEKKSKKRQKHGVKVLSGVVSHQLCPTIMCHLAYLRCSVLTNATLASVTLIPGRRFPSREGVSDFTTIERRSSTSVFS